jgi:hypothetical protein
MMSLLAWLFPPKPGILEGARLERSFYGQIEHDGSWAGNVKEWSPLSGRWVPHLKFFEIEFLKTKKSF